MNGTFNVACRNTLTLNLDSALIDDFDKTSRVDFSADKLAKWISALSEKLKAAKMELDGLVNEQKNNKGKKDDSNPSIEERIGSAKKNIGTLTHSKSELEAIQKFLKDAFVAKNQLHYDVFIRIPDTGVAGKPFDLIVATTQPNEPKADP